MSTIPVDYVDPPKQFICSMKHKDGSFVTKIVKPSNHHECRRYPPLTTFLENVQFTLREWEPLTRKALYHQGGFSTAF